MSHRFNKLWQEYRQLALFIFLMVIFRSTLADWNVVPTGSMNPTIVEGDRIFVNKIAYDLRVPLTHISLYRHASPDRGDIVVFDSAAADKRMVKRVIGLPGDHIAMHNNQLFINGIAATYSSVEPHENFIEATEKYGDLTHKIRVSRTGSRLSSFDDVTVPEDHYLVLGDNRDNSADSRVYGFIPREEIVGRSKDVVMSLDYDNYYLPRSDRFFQPL